MAVASFLPLVLPGLVSLNGGISLGLGEVADVDNPLFAWGIVVGLVDQLRLFLKWRKVSLFVGDRPAVPAGVGNVLRRVELVAVF